MNERDKWLDERIRRGVTAWRPSMPAHLDELIQKRVNAIGVGERCNRKRPGRWKGVAAAAAVLAGGVLLWTGLPKSPESIPVVTRLPRKEIRYAVPPAVEIALPESLPAAARPMRSPSVPPIKQTDTVEKPKQVDLMLSIPDKNITIVWCRREDFDLFTGRNR